jgi:integrase
MLRTINEPEWGEAVGLRWADIDLEGGALSVSRAIASVDGVAIETEPKTSKGRRAIALDPATVDALRRNRERQAAERELVGDGWTESGAFFTYPDGRTLHPDHVMVTFRRLVTGAGLPLIRLHDREAHVGAGRARCRPLMPATVAAGISPGA